MGEPSMKASSGETPLGPKLPLRLGRFILCEELGAGGMATVYLSRMEMAGGLERLAALKTIHPHLAKEKPFVDMFLDEARIASHVGHPNVCATYDFGEHNGVYYLAMEYLLGEPLFDVINRLVERFDDVEEVLPFLAARIIADAAEGLHAAHAARAPTGEQLHIVHRDVSPQNLFLTYDGSVKVVDFGCAKAAERVAHTSTGVMKGKVGYAAPEQLKSGAVDARADVWALGVCLWESLTCSPLFSRSTAVQTAMAVLEDEIESAADGREWVPRGVAAIAEKALQRDPAKRYASARDMSRELRRFIADSGFTLESAELAEWMDFLFEDRRADRVAQATRVRDLDLSAVSIEEVTADDVELLESSPAPLEAEILRDSVPHEPASSFDDAVERSGPFAKGARHSVAEPEDDAPAPRRSNRWLWVTAALIALGVGGYFAQLYYEPAPWLLDMVGVEPAGDGDPTVTAGGGAGDSTATQAGSLRDGVVRDGVVRDGVVPDGVDDGVDEDEADGTEDERAAADDEQASAADDGSEDDGAGTEAEDAHEDDGATAGASGRRSGAGSDEAARDRGRRSGRRGGGGGGSSTTTVVSGGGGSGGGTGGSGTGTSGGSTGGATSAGGSTAANGAGGAGSPARLAADDGILSLETSSGWAEVYANGRRLGRTPIRAHLPAGRYRLRLLPYGQEPASPLPVHIEAGIENHLVIDVGPAPP